jgi:hypothetical protein
MKGLVAHLKFPRGFVLSGSATSTGPAATDEGFFPLEDLLPSATSSVRVAGAFTSEVSGDMLFEAEAGSRGADGKFLSAQKTEVHVPVLAGDLTLRFVANGSDTDRTIQPGDSLRVALAYQNTSPEPIKGVTLQVGVETFVNDRSATGTSLLDWTRLDDPSHGVTSTKPRIQTVSYTKTQIPQLEVLEPQAEGRVEFSLPTLAVASGTKDAWIRLTVQGVVSTVGGVKVNRMVHAQPINLHYRSDADVSVEARYFTEEGAPLGFGPLPPVAGKTTAYRVVWELTKTLHPLEQMTVTAVLPKAAAWSEKTIVDAGNMSYDAASRTVRWELRTVPQEVKDLQASFEIQLTPETLDIGRFANLLSETKFEAQDPVVNEAISRSKPPLTTDLQNDEGARGKGVVRKD